MDLRTVTCSKKIDISTTSFYEVKYRLGYKGKPLTIEMFNEIEKVVEGIRKCGLPVTARCVSQYLENEAMKKMPVKKGNLKGNK